MSNSIYFKATGKALEKIKAFQLTRTKGQLALLNAVKPWGELYSFHASEGGVYWVGFKKAPDQALWRKYREGWVPRKKTEEGKKIAAMLSDIKIPDVHDLMWGLLGTLTLGGMGLDYIGTQPYVIASDDEAEAFARVDGLERVKTSEFWAGKESAAEAAPQEGGES